MRRNLPIAIAALMATLLLAACGNSGPTPTPSSTPAPYADIHPELGKPFAMRIGYSAFINEDGYRIDLKRVSSDSRCPPTGQCLQPDVALIIAEIRETASSQPRSQQLFFDSGTSVETVGGYSIQVLDLDPAVDEVKSQDDYIVTLLVTEAPADLTLNPQMTYSRSAAKVGDEITFTASADGSGLAQYTLTANESVIGILRYDGTLVRDSQSPAVELVGWSADDKQASWTVKMLNAGGFTMTVTVSGEVPIGGGAWGYAYGSASTPITID